jgi:hypothetical protein
MLLGLNHTAGARLAMAAVVVILGATNGFAGPNNRKPTVVVHPRYVPYVPRERGNTVASREETPSLAGTTCHGKRRRRDYSVKLSSNRAIGIK